MLSRQQNAFHKLLLFFTVVTAIRYNFPWFENKETDPGKSADLSKATQLVTGRAERQAQSWPFPKPLGSLLHLVLKTSGLRPEEWLCWAPYPLPSVLEKHPTSL